VGWLSFVESVRMINRIIPQDKENILVLQNLHHICRYRLQLRGLADDRSGGLVFVCAALLRLGNDKESAHFLRSE
jgi:hypothetical protein